MVVDAVTTELFKSLLQEILNLDNASIVFNLLDVRDGNEIKIYPTLFNIICGEINKDV